LRQANIQQIYISPYSLKEGVLFGKWKHIVTYSTFFGHF
jgi:hypothetical protein